MSIRIVVFGSGRGTNFQHIYHHIQTDQLDVEISCVITNNSDAGIKQFSDHHDLKTWVYQRKQYENQTDYENDLLNTLQNEAPDYILLAGYMKQIPKKVIHAFPNRILNIHPSLLPLFGGQGMFGMNVHEAVFRSGMKVSGATVHFVTEQYDEGPIIMQRAVDIDHCETAQEIAECVLKQEHELYYDAFKLIITHKYMIKNNRVSIEK